LRQLARRLTPSEITSPEIQQLVADMFYTLETKKYGVGLAAPQVGQNVAISVINIQKMPWRPDVDEYTMVIINPEITATYGRRSGMWEGCISFCGDQKDFPYAKALRWRKVRVKYLDLQGKQHEQDFEGLLSHIMQHETDHLNGVLFVDRVRDPKTYIAVSEYNKHYRSQNKER
jgi:peptide deformylase